MNTQNINFNFMNKDEPIIKDYSDTFVLASCILAFFFTIFFVLIPEKNIEKSGKELENFHKSVNLDWIDNFMVRGYALEDRNKKAQYLFAKDSVEEKIKFLITTHSILMEQKNNINKEIYLSQIMKDRKDILDYLIVQFQKNKETKFDCHFASCKDKEYRVTQEKLQTIKLFNLKLNNYYLDLINLYEKDKKHIVKVPEINFNVTKALTKEESKIYQEIRY